MAGFAVNHLFGPVARLALAAGLVLAARAVPAAEPPIAGLEPVLGLRFPTGRVQFEALPAEVLEVCRAALADGPREREAWLLASATEAGHRYVVVGGYFVQRAGEAGGTRYELDTRGTVVDLGGSGCESLGPARQVFDARPEKMPPAALERLAADLAERYARAFGSPDGLHAAMRRQRVIPPKSSAVLRQALGVEEAPVPAR